MLSIGGSTTRVYLAVGATDMRKRTRLKLIYFDGSGTWLCAKRLERGKFEWPQEMGEEKKIALSATELAALVDGLELTQTRAKRWWRKKIAA